MDADSIDYRNWHEWLQLFVQGSPICAPIQEAPVEEEGEEKKELEGEEGEAADEGDEKEVEEKKDELKNS